MTLTRTIARALGVGCALLGIAEAAGAQVGYPPERSPFRDLEYKHELTLFGGWYKAGEDPAGVAPRSGPMAGVRYEARVGGPAQLMIRAALVQSERQALDPTRPQASRDLGVHDATLFLVDAGISVNITGQKSFRRLVPTANAGIGIAGGGKDVEGDPFRFGTPFAITYGLGLRHVPGGRFAMRLGIDAYLYQVKYPEAYYAPASDNTAVLETSQAKNIWKNNVALTIGASYLFFR